ncbi:MAG: hypothetical protein QOE01_3434 [Actinomycetota bacterium]|jgi:hypothetical protein|nr:hypothetical protein [Actinomycetota bacterium]
MIATTTAHPTWCDPRWCQAEAPLADDRWHHCPGEDVPLSLENQAEDEASHVEVFLRQHAEHSAPRFGLHVLARDLRGKQIDTDVHLTVFEAIALRDQLSARIAATRRLDGE